MLFTKMKVDQSYIKVFLCDDSFLDQLICILLQNNWLLTNLLVHQWLSKHRLVNFIMAVTSVAHLQNTQLNYLEQSTKQIIT